MEIHYSETPRVFTADQKQVTIVVSGRKHFARDATGIEISADAGECISSKINKSLSLTAFKSWRIEKQRTPFNAIFLHVTKNPIAAVEKIVTTI